MSGFRSDYEFEKIISSEQNDHYEGILQAGVIPDVIVLGPELSEHVQPYFFLGVQECADQAEKNWRGVVLFRPSIAFRYSD